ncbi:hypothetical protein [Kitasatospora sp. NPDC101183]|uniref:hypothetical protein n=1 Tax=Kitasatospora sp. NPDC101183 TaxID=3364100 RepID=UPI003830D30E
MGASSWDYLVECDGDVGEAVEALQTRLFQEEFGDGSRYASLEELHEDEEFLGEEGTHSILDIVTVLDRDFPPKASNPADHLTLRPLARDRAAHHFGSGRPTVEQYERLAAASRAARSDEEREQCLFAECRVRWTGLYVLLHTGVFPTHLGIFGVTGD